MSEKLGDAILELSTTDRKFRRGLRSAEGLARKSGARMTKFLTIPLVLLGAAAGRAAATFGDEMNKLVSLVGLPREAVENELIPALLKLGPAVGILPAALARGIFPIASAGFDASQSLDILTASAMAAAIGVGNVETAALGTTKILANYGDQLDSAAEATAVLVETTKAAAAAPEEMAAAFSKFLPIAAALKIDLRTVAAEFAFLTRPLENAAKASEVLRNTLNKLRLPPIELIPLLEKAGVSLKDLKDAMVGTGGVTAGLRLLEKALGRDSLAFQRIFQDQSAFDGMVKLLDADTRSLTKVMQDLATSGVGSLISAFQEATKSPMFRFRQGMAAINAAMIVLGNAVLPLVIPFVIKLTDIIVRASRAFAALTPKAQNAILSIAAIVAIAGPVLLTISLIIRAFRGLLVVAWATAKGVGRAMIFMMNAIEATMLRIIAVLFSVPGLIVLALTTIVVLFFGFRDTIVTLWNELWTVISTNTKIALRNLKNAILRGFIIVTNGILSAINKARSLIGKEAVGLIPTTAFKPEKLLGFSEFDAGKIAASFKSDINKIKATVTSTLNGMVDAIKGIIPEGLMDLFFPDGLEQTQLDIDAILKKMGELPNTISGIGEAGRELAIDFEQVGESIASSISAATTDAIVNLRSLASFARSVSDIILSSIISASIGKATGNLFGNLFGGPKAKGGRFSGNKPFLVGEKGPEIVAPGRSGTVIPNDAIGKGSSGGDTFVFQAGLPAELAAQVRNVAAEVAAGTAVQTIKEAFAR